MIDNIKRFIKKHSILIIIIIVVLIFTVIIWMIWCKKRSIPRYVGGALTTDLVCKVDDEYYKIVGAQCCTDDTPSDLYLITLNDTGIKKLEELCVDAEIF